MTRPTYLLAYLFVFTFTLAMSQADAEDKRWNDGVSGGWFDPANWEPAGVPTPDDSVQISNGSVALSSPVVISNRLVWSGGVLHSGSITIAAGAIAELTGDADKILTAAQLINRGQLIWSGAGNWVGQFTGFGQAVLIENSSSGQIETRNDAQWFFSSPGYGAETFRVANNGLILKTGGPGATSFTGPIGFEHNGQITLDSGRLLVPQGMTCNGRLDVAAGAAVLFTGGTVNFGPGHEARGEGFFGVAEGSVTLVGVARGRLDWSGGRLTGGAQPLTIATNGILYVRGDADKLMTALALQNAGQVEWTGNGRLVADFTGYGQTVQITNLPTGLISILNDTNFLFSSPGLGAETCRFLNAGTVRKGSSPGTTRFEGPIQVANAGLLELQSGTLRLDHGITQNGQCGLAAGTALEITGGQVTLGPTNTIAGSGQFAIPSGSVTLNGAVNQQLYLIGGDLSGAIKLDGTLHWTGGRFISGALHVTTNGSLQLTGPADKPLVAFGVVNEGTWRWAGEGRLVALFTGYGQAVLITNAARGSFIIENDTDVLFSSPGYGAETFVIHNEGLVRKASSAGTTAFDGPIRLINAGVVQVEQGRLRFQQPITSRGRFEVAAGTAVELSAGRVDLQPGHRADGPGFFGVRDGAVSLFGEVHGHFDWTGGTWSGSDLLIAADGQLMITGAENKTIIASTLNNAGSVHWTGSGPLVGLFNSYGQTIALTNLEGAAWHLASETNLVFSSDGVGAETFRFHNAGLLRKEASDATNRWVGPIALINTGQVAVDRGTLLLDSGLTSAGPISVATNAAFMVSGGKLALTDDATLEGDGLIDIPAGNVALSGNLRGHLRVSGGMVSGDTTIQGTVDWTGGQLVSGSWFVNSNAVLNLSGDADKSLTAFTLNNAGLLRWSNDGRLVGQFTGYGQSVLITNLPSGTFELLSDTNLVFSSPGYGAETMRFHNAGTLIKRASYGTSAMVGLPVRNTGLIDVESGAIDFAGGIVNEGTIIGGAKISLATESAGTGEPLTLLLTTVSGLVYRVEVSPDLRQWDLLTITNAPGPLLEIQDPDAANAGLRYYRARVDPGD